MNTRIAQNENNGSKLNYASYVNFQNNRQFGKEITNQIKPSSENDPLQNQLAYFQQQHQKLKVLQPTTISFRASKQPVEKASDKFRTHKFSFRVQQIEIHLCTSGTCQHKKTFKQQASLILYALLARAFQEESVLAIEEEFDRKPEHAIPYVNEIFAYLVEKESFYQPQQNYMQFQTDITSSMRSILIDWLVDVHLKFKLAPETLFLTVNLIDRFLSRSNVLRTKLQLVGVSAMFIASKFEEIYPPDVKDFVYVCDRTYPKEEILDMESKILSATEFNLTHTSSLRFLERQINGANLCERVSQTAKMIIELSLLDIRYLKYPPSLQATAAILLGINLLKSPQVLPQSLYFHDVSEKQEELKQCLSETLLLLQSLKKDNLSAVRRKYNSEVFGRVSELICNIIK